jgi:hypothetical protein
MGEPPVKIGIDIVEKATPRGSAAAVYFIILSWYHAKMQNAIPFSRCLRNIGDM